MTVYYTLTFMLLAAEMVTFCLLVAPLPYTVRKKMFSFLTGSPFVAKILYALKISFIFVGILFVDALQRMFRVTAESDLAKSGQQGAGDIRAESSMAARKFYSQRNTYLTGFTLFLSLVLTRTFQITLDLIHAQEEYAKLKKELSSRGTNEAGDARKEIAELKKSLAEAESKVQDFEIFKKQAKQQADEYNRLATEYNEATGNVSDKRKD